MSHIHSSHLCRLSAVLAVVLLLAGCSFFGGDDKYFESDLIGRWQAPSESDIAPDGNYQYCVFLAERDSAESMRYGYMWDMGDHADWDYSQGDYEDFLLNEELHGNGWFIWRISGKQLEFYHFMSEGWSTVPKTYTITTLTSDQLTYKDDFGNYHSFTRINATKAK